LGGKGGWGKGLTGPLLGRKNQPKTENP